MKFDFLFPKIDLVCLNSQFFKIKFLSVFNQFGGVEGWFEEVVEEWNIRRSKIVNIFKFYHETHWNNF